MKDGGACQPRHRPLYIDTPGGLGHFLTAANQTRVCFGLVLSRGHADP